VPKNDLPPLPEGFVLEEPNNGDTPPLPEGFVLEEQPLTSYGQPRNPLQDAIDKAKTNAHVLGSEPIAETAEEEERLNASLRQLAHGATFNQSDLLGAVYDRLRGQDFDEAKAARRQQIQQDLDLVGAGPQIAGGVLTGVAGGALGAAAKLGVALPNMAMGAVAGYGAGDDAVDEYGNPTGSGLEGGLVGTAIGGAVSAAGPAAKALFKAGPAIRQMASRFSGRTADFFGSLNLPVAKLEQLGRKLIDTGITGGVKGYNAMANQISSLKTIIGGQLDDMYRAADAAIAQTPFGGFKPTEIFGAIEKNLGKYYSTAEARSFMREMANRMPSVGERFNASSLRELIRSLEDSAGKMAATKDGAFPAAREAALRTRDFLYQVMDDMLPNQSTVFKEARQFYHTLTQASEGVEETLKRTYGKILPEGGVARVINQGGVLRNVTQKGLNFTEMMTSPSRWLAKLPPQYQKLFTDSVTKGSNAMAVTHHLLIKSDSNYRKLHQENNQMNIFSFDGEGDDDE